MTDERWSLWVYNGRGDLWERHEGTEMELRRLGVRITAQRRQLAWRCELRRNGLRVAVYKRGVWKDVAP